MMACNLSVTASTLAGMMASICTVQQHWRDRRCLMRIRLSHLKREGGDKGCGDLGSGGTTDDGTAGQTGRLVKMEAGKAGRCRTSWAGRRTRVCGWVESATVSAGSRVDAGRWDCTVHRRAPQGTTGHHRLGEGGSTASHRVMDAARSRRH